MSTDLQIVSYCVWLVSMYIYIASAAIDEWQFDVSPRKATPVAAPRSDSGVNEN